ncbi:MAG: RNA polymerase factor sigma-54 [Treponema sp.]|nr:RNA polymerase factor sigma-54 [Treponema sp.]
MSGFDFLQKQQQSQVQIMSQQQIQSLSILSLGTDELKDAVYEEAEKNPALVVKNAGRKKDRVLSVKVGSASAAGEQASEVYQNALESKADMRQSLQDALLEQLNMESLSEAEHAIGEKLIGNLDSKGYHILAPVTLLDKNDAAQTEALLFKCMTRIQRFEPVGTCVKNMEESLAVQASVRTDCPATARFILDGHFDFLNPPQTDKICKKIAAYQKERKSLFGAQETEPFLDMEVTEHDVSEALSFIRSLDPYPARNYSTQDVHYVQSDVSVVRLDEVQEENFDKGIVTVKDSSWQVSLSNDFSFDLDINPVYARHAAHALGTEKTVIQEGIKKAQAFISSVEMRQNTVLRSCCLIVKRQHEFFKKGPGNLIPLKQLDIANIMGVHESTISRMANSKYLECEWGLFDIKYFFVNAVAENTSKDKILKEIRAIIEEHKDDKKKLSDQKISDILQSRGITVARRTVAKYRSSL